VNPALERQQQQFEADPSNVPAFEALEEHHFLGGEWDALVALYEQRLTAPDLETRPAVQARLLFRLAQVLEERCERSNDARTRYEQAARLAPDFQPVLRRLRVLYTENSQWELALQIGELEASTPMRPVERAAFQVEMGRIWLDRLGETEQALELFDRALRDDVRSQDALRGRARALAALERTPEAVESLERILTTTPAGPEQATVLLEMAQMSEDHAERSADLYARALQLAPDDPAVVEAAAQAAVRAEKWDAACDLAERRFALTAGAERRVQIALETAGLLLEHRGETAAARSWLERAAELAPDDCRVHLALADANALLGDDAAHLAALERAATLAPNQLPVDALLELGEARLAGGDADQALVPLRLALERAPERSEILDALLEAHRARGSHDELIDLLETRAATADGRTRAEALAQIAAIHERHGDEEDAANEALLRAFDTDPTTPGVAVALERLYRKAEEWDELRRILERARDAAPEDERPALLCSLGELFAGPLNEAHGAQERARGCFEAVLDVDPAAERALRGLAELAAAGGDQATLLAAWEREVEATGDAARRLELCRQLAQRHEEQGDTARAARYAERVASETPDDPDALASCAELLERLECHDALTSVLERLAPHRVGAPRAALEKRLAALHAAGGRSEAAVERLEAAVDADPDDVEALRELAGRLREANRLDALARTWRNLAARVNPAESAQILSDLAALLVEELSDPDAAVVVLWRLVEDPDAPSDVDKRLEQALERTSRFGELAQRLFERRQTVEDGSPEALELDLRRARVLRVHLGQNEQAAPLYRAAYERLGAEDPRSLEPLDGLEECARGAGDDAALAWALGERARHAQDGEQWAHAQLERAMLLEERLGELEDARRVYADLVEAGGPVAGEADTRLIRLLERLRAWQPLRERLEAQAAQADASEAVALHERAAELCLRRLDDPDGAARALSAAVELAPERIELCEHLARLHEDAGHPGEARRALERALENDLGSSREVALHCSAARLARAEDDEHAARAHLERVLELEPGHADAVALLADHYRSQGRTEELIELLTSRLGVLEAMQPPDPAGATSLRVRIAELQDQTLGDADAAVRTLAPAAGRVDTSAEDGLGAAAEAATPLADLLAREGRLDDLVQLATRMREATRDPAACADWGVRLGAALRECGDAGRAIACYRDVLGRRPGDASAQQALRELYREVGDWEPLARLLEAQLRTLAGEEEVALRVELAGVLSEHLGRPADALAHLRRILEVVHGHAQVADAALALAEELGASDVLLELVDAAITHAGDRPRRATLLVRRGRLLSGPLERAGEGVAAFREALALLPDDPNARAALRAALEQMGDWHAYLDELHLQLQASPSDERVALLERAVAIAEEHLSPDAALPWLERLRVERSDDADVVKRIAEVHRRAGRPEALLRALEAQAALTSDNDQRRELELEVAQVLERDLGSPARALAALEATHHEDPRHPGVLAELDRLYEAGERPRDRAEILEKRLAATPEAKSGPLHRALAELYRGPLVDSARAAEHFAAALEHEATGPAGLLQARGQALREAGRMLAWAEVAEAELEALDADDPVFRERRRELHRTLADSYRRNLGDPDAGLRHLRALLDAPEPEADDDLALAERRACETALLDALRRDGAHAELATRLAQRLKRDPDARGWLELARLREERLHAPAAAAEAYAAALDADPEDLDALRGRRRTAERQADFEAVAQCLERELELRGEASAHERAGLLRALGDVCRRHLGATTRASRAFAEALETLPGDLGAVRALEELFEAMEDWQGAADLLGSEIELLGDAESERRRTLHLRVADLASQRLSDPARAVHNLRGADRLAELEAPRRRLLADLLRESGDLEGCAAEMTRWCDSEGMPASGADHLALAEVIQELGRDEAALARVERGLEIEPGSGALWCACARLHETLEAPERAAEAWAAAADASGDSNAACYLLRAAELVEATEPERALDWLRRGSERDPGAPEVHAKHASLAERCGEADEAEAAAGRSLDLAAAGSHLTAEAQLEAALVGARAAQARGDLEATTRFSTTARAIDPDSLEALSIEARVLFAMGEIQGARRALERRLEAAGNAGYDERAEHLALLGAALEAAGELDPALTRYGEALEFDSECDDARAGVVRVHERAGRFDDALEARLAWAEHAAAPIRARQLVRVAELELARGGSDEDAEAHVRRALEADPASADAHLLLTTRMAESGRHEEALELCTAGLEHASASDVRARLACLRAQLLELRGERRSAAEAWGIAAQADPSSGGAALSQARILRALGEWEAAAEALAHFAERHLDPSDPGLAPVQFQRGRLLAGPLERVDEALDAYRAAIAANPRFREAHAALAGLLVHQPESWDEALARLRDLLEAKPTDAAHLRGVLKIAQGRERSSAVHLGRRVLSALGAATAEEREHDPVRIEPTFPAPGGLENPVWECARRLAVAVAEEIGRALGAPAESAPVGDPGDPLAAYRTAALAAEGELAAPGLVPLEDGQVAEVLRIVAELACDAEQVHGDGHRVNRLSSELGRRARRRLRRELGSVAAREIAEIDFAAWRCELRTLAHFQALAQSGSDLRTALLALLESDAGCERPGPNADLAAALEGAPAALALLRRVVLSWIDGI